jgi:hypothetical protein
MKMAIANAARKRKRDRIIPKFVILKRMMVMRSIEKTPMMKFLKLLK